MARAITRIEDLPAHEQAQAALIEEAGFTGWYYLPARTIPAGTGSTFQVRDTKYIAPPMEVAKYQLAYKNGDVLPAIVTTEDDVLADGNTRRAGALKAKLTTLPTFVLRFNYEDAPEPVRRQLKILATKLNQINGRQMTRQNVEAIIMDVADDDDTPKTLAAKLNCSPVTVAGVLSLRKGIRRGERLGVERGDLTLSHMKVLGGKEPKLNDAPFAALMALSRDAHFSVKEMGDLCNRLETCLTDKAKLELLADERKLNADRIRGISTRPSSAGVVRRNLGGIRKYEDNPEGALEKNPDLVGRYLAELYQTRSTIDKIIQAQSRTEHSRTPVRVSVPATDLPEE